MLSFLQHPFITYTFILSAVLWAGLMVFASIIRPGTGRHVSRLNPGWYALPLAIPVISYLINYVLLGKTCGFDRTYLGSLSRLPSVHIFCMINHRVVHWIGPLSLIWLILSLSLYGLRWYRTWRVIHTLPRLGRVNPRAASILDSLSAQLGISTPELVVLQGTKPVLMTIGFIRHRILVSTGTLDLLDEAELQASLAHELAHIRRKGHWMNLLFILLRDLTMFSPASLWAYHAFHHEEERTCDEWAATRTGLGVELASALLKFSKSASSATGGFEMLPALLPKKNAVVSRINLLLEEGGSSRKAAGSMIIAFLMITALIFVC